MMLALQARYDEALLTLERAGEVYRLKEDLEGELRALAQVGRIHRWRGTSWQGLTRLLPLLQRLPQIGASRGAAAFYVALAYLYKGAGQYSEQLAAAEQAATLARASGDDYILTTAQERRAAALLALGRLEETCRALTKEVIPASEASGNLWTLITRTTIWPEPMSFWATISRRAPPWNRRLRLTNAWATRQRWPIYSMGVASMPSPSGSGSERAPILSAPQP